MSRFDYVKYDDDAVFIQKTIKAKVEELETLLCVRDTDADSTKRSKSLAIQALEVFYMWTGKAIRDDQIKRNGEAELQKERTNP